jgi:hypothetical protein
VGIIASMLRPYDDEARHLVSRKGFTGDCESEVSGTANICTEEHELYMRHLGLLR